jgi:predicted enzyme related to lactoylglutathione lyase
MKPAVSGEHMKAHGKLDYVEFPSTDTAARKGFFARAFGWTFTDYGPDYTAFSGEGLDGGFFKAAMPPAAPPNAALLVFFSIDLEATLEKVTAAGGVITQAIFDFPGGRRFQFREPGGNVLAVWAEPA